MDLIVSVPEFSDSLCIYRLLTTLLPFLYDLGSLRDINQSE